MKYITTKTAMTEAQSRKALYYAVRAEFNSQQPREPYIDRRFDGLIREAITLVEQPGNLP